MATGVAVAAHEASRQVAAREVALEGLDDVARQRGCVGGARVLVEGREVLADEAMEGCVLRPSRDVAGRGGHARPCAPAVPARSCGHSAGSVPRGGGAAMAGTKGRSYGRPKTT